MPRSARGGVTIDPAGVIRVRVAAPPVDGEANAAVIRLLAKALGLAQRDVVLVAGAASRQKTLETPLDEAEVRRRLTPP